MDGLISLLFFEPLGHIPVFSGAFSIYLRCSQASLFCFKGYATPVMLLKSFYLFIC